MVQVEINFAEKQNSRDCQYYSCFSFQGCYSSICEDGMLKIMIENATFTCHEAGQVIDISLAKDEWLHEGSIICPNCQLFCDDCKNPEENSNGQSDKFTAENESFKQTLDDVECKARPRINTILGFLQNLGLNPDSFS